MENNLIDFKKLNIDFDNDREIIKDLFNDLFSSTKNIIKIISDAIKENDLNTIIREAHTVKGGAFNLYADSLGQAAQELEMTAKSSNLSEMEPALNKVKENLEYLEKYFKEIF